MPGKSLGRGDELCFTGGTLVHTREGLLPIESIKIGDWVLSQREQTGERTYKRVVKIANFENKAVFRVKCDKLLPGGSFEMHNFIVTGNHPFYIARHNTEDVGGRPEKDLKKPRGWRRADLLEYGAQLELANGELLRVVGVGPIWRARTEGVGWIDSSRWSEIGNHIDLREGKIEETFAGIGVVADFMKVGGFCDRYDDEEIADEWAYKCAVYNLEVEDCHTYCVGEPGVWVACDKA